MASNTSIIPIDSDVFFVEQLSSEPGPQRNKSPNIVKSTELSGSDTKKMPTISSITSPEPDFVTLDDDSNDPTFPYGFGAQQPIVPPSLKDLDLPSKPFKILEAMAVVQQNPTHHDNNYSPQSPKPSEPSPISTAPINLSTIDGCETPHTTTDDKTSYSEDEPKRVHWTYPVDETFHSEGEPRRIYLMPIYPAVTTSQGEKEVRDRNVLSKKRGSVAACLRSLRRNDSPKKGHCRAVYQRLKLYKC